MKLRRDRPARASHGAEPGAAQNFLSAPHGKLREVAKDRCAARAVGENHDVPKPPEAALKTPTHAACEGDHSIAGRDDCRAGAAAISMPERNSSSFVQGDFRGPK